MKSEITKMNLVQQVVSLVRKVISNPCGDKKVVWSAKRVNIKMKLDKEAAKFAHLVLSNLRVDNKIA